MHAYNRLSSSAHNSPSPPSSPRRSPRYRHGRTKSGRIQGVGPPLPPRTFMQKFAWLLLSVLLKRHGVFLFAPLIYLSGMLLYMGTMSFDVRGVDKHPPPGSIYRSPQVFNNLWPAMQADNTTYDGLMAAWQQRREGGRQVRETTRNTESSMAMTIFRNLFRVAAMLLWCSQLFRVGGPNTSSNGLPDSNGFVFIEANGGLNQQRTSICNAVAVAGLLNATLVIPNFHFHSIWRDPSKFKDIYDEEHFINTLRDDVRVVRKLPEVIMEKFGNNMSNIFNFRAKAWSPVSYYQEKVLPKLLEDGVIRISPFANRLSSEVPPPIQRLRCLANYEALRFADPIATLSEKLVDRMIKHSGKYISVHLRYEEDMVAFSCCVYNGGEEEKRELDAARERGWRGKFNRTGRIIRPGAIRMNGKCPLTPLEDYSSRMAALDYTVCLRSEVFVTTQGGNFPHFLMGHRRYFYGGHSKTIKPDKRKLALLLDNPNIRWETFKQQMQAMRRHSDVKGIEIRKINGSVYTFPTPNCMCRENNLPKLGVLAL